MFFASLGMVNAQKVVKKNIIDVNAAHLLIDAANCFKIDLTTNTSKEMVVEAIIDGEYRNDLLVKIEEETSFIKISAGFQPGYIIPNDKLSAHKVISISLRIQVPEQMNVHLFGTNCNVHAAGLYTNLKVTLDDGLCNLENVSKNTVVTTQSGDIYVQSKGATVETKNSFGTVFNGNIPIGDDFFKLSTVTGNIYMKKIE